MKTKKKTRSKKTKRRLLVIVLLLFAFIIYAHYTITKKVEMLTNVTIEFGNQKMELESREKIKKLAEKIDNNNHSISVDYSSISPFKEVELLDKEGKDWSNVFDGFAGCGILVFDANDDGLLDLYLTHNGENWTRPTNEAAVIQDQPFRQYNGLYLNQGNDKNNDPIYKQVKDLMVNDTYQEEELLIENFRYPRKSVNESTNEKMARLSVTAVAVDINGDGRKDLVVGNGLNGMFWSHNKTQRVLGQFVRPVGREAVSSKVPMSAQGMYFIDNYVPNENSNEVRESSRGKENDGSNSVFLNMGDKDADGLPEWKDISRSSGLEGKRTTLALLAEDFDRDGDIDIFECNIMDPDYWPGGSNTLAGAANQLYINQLKETGELTFKELSSEFNCDGLYDEDYKIPEYYRMKKYPLLSTDYSIAMFDFETYTPDYLEINGEKSEPGQISWAAVSTDANEDGYPDIWVANDLGYMRLYLNKKGKGFELAPKHVRHDKTGYWMSLTPADFNGDLKEDLFAGNNGGASMNLAHPLPDPHMLFDPVMTSGTTAQQFFGDKHRSMHAFVDGADFTNEMNNKVRHSKVLPPDASIPNNIRNFGINQATINYDPGSIDPYEFTWGSTSIDVQNDGKNDLYWIGCLYGRGGGIFPIMGTGPGRLLVNKTEKGEDLKFVDLTAEYHLFNIQELKYDKLKEKNYVYRKAPRQNWGKKSMVYSYDVSVWGFQGPDLAEKITNHDLIQTAENGRAAIAADLNNDGFQDVIVRNMGGYDSRSSNSKNLKANINGKLKVISAHDPNFPSPTNYEPGSTRFFMNQHSENNWVKIRLKDDSIGALNVDAIGAKIYINEKYMKFHRVGGGGFIANFCGPVHFGLNTDVVNTIRIEWPDAKRTIKTYQANGFSNGLLTITKTKGVLTTTATEL